ncbi:DUF4238 domain-containing protein [Pseudomonas chlororaphis]|uniref:DUF4238 domain-containing protein n=1 Tax=Pseudomonas chlororaphis TaxID=587753 RepID=UPI00131A5B7A|nr:DUF4238 domain-containing protein [Pseudomonas chlororaphis]
MASNKNQHFVPRCYLRPFTHRGEGLAISLFNIDRRRYIKSAPVKNQCSRDYFYGEDLVIERWLQRFEGSYAAGLSEILRVGYELTDAHRDLLRNFCLLQYLRTEAASRRTVEMSVSIEKVVDSSSHFLRATIIEAVQIAMRAFHDARMSIDDLKVCLIRNRTSLPFVTSDDPAVMTNRWHQQDRRVRGVAPGLASSGALLMLPLSPEILCLAYDGDVYSVDHKNGWVEVKRESDIYAFNQHQFLNCGANIYFRDWTNLEHLCDAYDTASPLRPEARHRLNYAVFDRIEDGQKVFRAIDPVDAKQHENALIHTEAIYPRPDAWPQQISWRRGGAAYTNGTAGGYLRRAKVDAVGGEGYRRVRLL